MRYLQNIDLKKFTTAGVGGPAKFFYKAASVEKLTKAINWANQQKLPYFILGAGSNIIVSDKGFPGLVIQNNIKGIMGFTHIIKVGAGVLLSQLITLTVKQKLSGLQKLSGIPGTVGGAVFGNAGAYGVSIGDFVTKVVVFDPLKEEIISLTKKQCLFGYRDSIFKKNNFIILEVHFKLLKASGNTLKVQMKEILTKRSSKNYWQSKNPGSFFKNIPLESFPKESLKLIPKDKIINGQIPAGFLLESVGAKGMKSGKIEVSLNHANLLINTGEGKASDFVKLSKILQEKVKEKYGIALEPEVQFINLPSL